MQNSQHCIYCLLPDTRSTAYFTRRKNHPYELPYYYHYSWSWSSFVNWSLYNIIWIIWCMVLFYITSNWYIISVLTTYSHVFRPFCCMYL